MQHKYLFILFMVVLCVGATLSTPSEAFASLPINLTDTTNNPKKAKSSIVDTRNNRPQNIKLAYKPFTPFSFNYKQDNGKTLSDVKVFPNPITDQLNLIFKLNKDVKVTIKVMDALGNEVSTLLSQNLSAGEQSQGFMINGKLNSGYYFIRIMAGSETIVKRIQVL